MKVTGEQIVVVPVDPTQLERAKDSKGFGVKSNGKKEWTLLWRVVSVGDGLKQMSSTTGAFLTRPLPVQVGDVIIRRRCDEVCREEWEKEIFYFNGERAMVEIGMCPIEMPWGNVMVLVSRDGAEVND